MCGVSDEEDVACRHQLAARRFTPEVVDVETRKLRRDLIDVSAAAERLGVSVRYVRRLVAERRIPYFKLGHLLRFDVEEVDAWLERAKVSEIVPSMASPNRR